MTTTAEPALVAPTPSIEDVTPELASALLGANTKNRSLRRQLVDMYAADMTKGAWQFTGEALKVEVMDSGAKRTSADALRLRDETNAVLLSSVARMILSEAGKRPARPTTTDLIQVVETDPTLRWVVNSGIVGVGGLRRVMTATVLGYAYWRLHKIDVFACAEFFSRLDTLTNLPQGSPILALHRRLSAHERIGDGANARREALSYIFMAWNAWRKNETRSIVKLAHTSDGQLSVPEPI